MEEAHTFAERIRHSCFEALESYSAPDHRAALSLGLNCFIEQDTSPDACMLRADRGIYRSKSLGGNQTCMTATPI
jgi:GGDEF domain-containing protein